MHFLQNLETKPVLIDFSRNQIPNDDFIENHIFFSAESRDSYNIEHIVPHFLPVDQKLSLVHQ